jgi:LysR family glycine cleavage system transcriptional activator
MRHSLPSLTALRVFDVAGRLLSFSRAAQELSVTQSAVSRQIRTLEEALGVELFLRMTRKVDLTEAGRTYLCEIQGALDDIERATHRLIAQRKRRVLTIDVLPSVASFWLMPRLADFTRQHPDIQTRIITSIGPVDFASGSLDVAIRVGSLPGRRYEARQPRIDLEMVTDWRGVVADYLFQDVLVPVISPALLRGRIVSRPEDLLDFPLIHTTSRAHAWPDWFRAHGIHNLAAASSIGYGHFFMSLEAAREGHGIAIVPDVLVEDAAPDELVTLFQPDTPSAGDYYLLTTSRNHEDREVALFRHWLQDQAKGRTPDHAMAPAVAAHG